MLTVPVVMTAALSRPLRSVVDESVLERRGVGDDLSGSRAYGSSRPAGFQ